MDEETIENHVPVITVNNVNKMNDAYHMHSPTRTEDIFRLKAFIDIKDDGYGFVERCDGKKLYRPYELENDRLPIMDVDGPLDLSIRRNM